MCVFLKQWCVLMVTVLFLVSPIIAAKPLSMPSDGVVVFINNINVHPGNKPSSNEPLLQTGAAIDQTLNEAELLPHRATYAISLDKPYDPDIDDVKGTMVLELRDGKDKWIYEQRATFFIKYHNEEGNEDTEQVNITVATWESKDGLRYNFYSQIKRSNQILADPLSDTGEIIQGEALMATPQGEGVVTYQQPQGLSVHLPAGTVFPMMHVAQLLKEATLQNHRVCSHLVFDGTNETHETVRVNTVITPTSPKIKFSDKVPFLSDHGWLMHMAIYGAEPEEEDNPDPDHEFDQRILPHGILAGLTLNFGDFDAKAELTELEFFKPSTDSTEFEYSDY